MQTGLAQGSERLLEADADESLVVAAAQRRVQLQAGAQVGAGADLESRLGQSLAKRFSVHGDRAPLALMGQAPGARARSARRALSAQVKVRRAKGAVAGEQTIEVRSRAALPATAIRSPVACATRVTSVC